MWRWLSSVWRKVLNNMPCNSDYMEATPSEVVASQLLCIVGEVIFGIPFTKHEWNGYHKLASSYTSKHARDNITAALCAMLQKEDVSKYSLETQMWWRDHQEADRKREAAKAK